MRRLPWIPLLLPPRGSEEEEEEGGERKDGYLHTRGIQSALSVPLFLPLRIGFGVFGVAEQSNAISAHQIKNICSPCSCIHLLGRSQYFLSKCRIVPILLIHPVAHCICEKKEDAAAPQITVYKDLQEREQRRRIEGGEEGKSFLRT